MFNKIILKIIEFFSKKIVYPISRWHNLNLFLHIRKDLNIKDRPSIFWLLFGRAYWYFQRIVNNARIFYFEAVVKNYSELIKKHYLEDYAYGKESLSSSKYKKGFEKKHGSMSELFKNSFLINIIGIQDYDSFLDCGCGEGTNIKEVFNSFPNSKVTAFDLSPNAIEFAKSMFKDKNVHIFQGSVLDIGLLNKFPNESVDNVFFANMLATLLLKSIKETRMARSQILKEAIRVAKKNVIINEKWTDDTKIFIEQRYRALFYEDYATYFQDAKEQGDILLAPSLIIFHKKLKQ